MVRQSAGLKQAQVADALGLSPASISNIERGAHHTTTEKLEMWVNLCGAHLLIVRDHGVGPKIQSIVEASSVDASDLLRLVVAYSKLNDQSRDHVLRTAELMTSLSSR